MLEGLEASEQKWSALERTHRLDAEYFRHEFVDCAVRLGSMPTSKVTAVAKISDGNHFSISDRFLDEGIPYYRGKDVSGHFFVEECDSTFIDEVMFNEKFLRRSHLRKGDILLSIVGTIGQLALVSDDRKATCSCKLAILRTKNHAKFLAIFLKSRYGALQIQRNTRGAVQMGLLLEDMDQLLVPAFSDRFMSRIDSMVDAVLQKSGEAAKLYARAETRLLEELELIDWQLKDPLSYVVPLKDTIETERLDAEYYKPSIVGLLQELKDSGCVFLDSVASVASGYPWKSEYFLEADGHGHPFVRIRDCKPGLLDNDTLTRLEPAYADGEGVARAQDGDILLGMDGLRWFYACQISAPCYVNQRVCHISPTNRSEYPPEYLALAINSMIGQTQLLREMTVAQTVGHITNENARQLLIPILTAEKRKNIADAVSDSYKARQDSKALLEKARRAVEIAVERGEAAATEYLDGRVYVQTQVLPAMAEQHKYFNLDALKARLAAQKLSYVPETVNAYVSRMKNEGKIFGAGRGWYSSLDTPFEVDTQPVAELVAEIEKKFPLLDFACWSTGQLNPYLHHMLGKYVSFVYVDRDAMSSVFDALQEMGYSAYLNPTRREVEKSFSVADKTVVIRPAVTKAPGDGHFARIEKLLVDLHVELGTFPLIERNEFREAAQSIISRRRIELAKLFTYAAQRKVNWREIFLNSDSVIAGGGQP